MNYTVLTVGNKELKLRLNARGIVALEQKLGKSPLAIFTKIEQGDLPTLEEMVIILQASLQALEHGYTLDATYDLVDEFIADGKSTIELMPVIIEVYQVSGIIPKEAPVAGEVGKNM